MALRILGANGGATIAESTGDKPVCRYCNWLELEQIILDRERLDEFVCQRPLKGSPSVWKCDLFERATGADDE
jgi:hypothetical protein